MKEKIVQIRQLSALIQALSVCLEGKGVQKEIVKSLVKILTNILVKTIKQLDDKIAHETVVPIEKRLEERRIIIKNCMRARHLAQGLTPEHPASIFQEVILQMLSQWEQMQTTRSASVKQLSAEEKRELRQQLWIVSDIEEAA